MQKIQNILIREYYFNSQRVCQFWNWEKRFRANFAVNRVIRNYWNGRKRLKFNEEKKEQYENELKYFASKDEDDDKNAIVEIRAGTEFKASLFVGFIQNGAKGLFKKNGS